MTKIHAFTVGDVKCITLNDGEFTGSADTFFAHAPDVEVRDTALRARGYDPQAVPSCFNPLYIESGDQRVIVDTGVGPSDDPNRGNLIASMAAAGITPESITAVVTTHAHGDHIGGNTLADGSPAFANATYYIWKGEWEHWTAPDTLEKMGERAPIIHKNLLGIQARYTMVETETEFLPGIQAVNAPGHTQGQMALLIGGKLLHVADAIHQPLQAEFPEWSPRFDSLPDISPGTRRRLLRLAVERDLLVFGYHFPFPGVGRVQREGENWRWTAL